MDEFCSYCFGVTEQGEMTHAVDCDNPCQCDDYGDCDYCAAMDSMREAIMDQWDK